MSDPLDLSDVTEDELAEALEELGTSDGDLRMRPDHPYIPSEDPYRVDTGNAEDA